MDFEESSLPEVIKSVSDAQITQANEIANHQKKLKIVQDELARESEKVSKLIDENELCIRKILQLEDKCSNLSTTCTQLETEIVKVSTLNVQLHQEKKVCEEEDILNEKMRKEYRSKMELHIQQCTDLEKVSVTHQALQEQKNIIKKLLDERQILESNPEGTQLLLEGVCEQNIQDDIQELEIKKINLNSNIDQVAKKVESSKERKKKLNQDIVVWHKRNVAQLTRLKKQVIEAQTYNRQWNEQACQLEKGIASLRKQLEE
ncbi:coiled-coil domain-containing protein 122-like [Antedon mediterranea]|uniref:coiled-coil domain-containing protein 122-like n=1 Tax=Antedon mediterranea TaxID=105859 RepID=UPI003AF4C669